MGLRLINLKHSRAKSYYDSGKNASQLSGLADLFPPMEQNLA